ncbi:MAG TPA: hypothetical protein DCY20_05720 [Firmicutes bacterium]|nr:hypothetical protein [Bacillota bacterium]
MRVNRIFLFIYDLFIILAYVLRFLMVGPILFGSTLAFYISFVLVAALLYYLNKQTYLHPSALEVVAYYVNLIVAHHYYGNSDDTYNEEDLGFITDEFLHSPNFEQFFYHEFNFKSSGAYHFKMKMTIYNETYNHTSIIIKTVDDKYIKFEVVKETTDALSAFLYEWKIDKIEYTDRLTFERAKRGLE